MPDSVRANWHFHYNPEKFDSCVNNLRLISVQACNKKTFFLSKNTIFLGLSEKETCLRGLTAEMSTILYDGGLRPKLIFLENE